MSSGKQKRLKRKLTRAERKAKVERIEHLVALRKGTVIAVDRSRIFSRSVLPEIPDHYRDTLITCRDCGEREIWTARQQQRWYEDQGGEIESIAVRCRACRRKEKCRRDTARKVHLEGLERKRGSTP
jgi:DNA-directed RNA polymerase subunit M/transcription elongation factor TFIIS